MKIHGHMEQKDRSRVFARFNEVNKGFLICTDIASRGLDFSSLSVIILFDVSASYKDYVNRVGRTARIENVGSAISFLYEKEINYARKLEKNCGAKKLEVDKLEKTFKLDYFKQSRTKVKNFAQFFDQQLKRKCTYDRDMKYLARRAFNSFCRAYSLLKDDTCFNLKSLNLH